VKTVDVAENDVGMTQTVNPKTLLVNHVKMVKTVDVAERAVTTISLVNELTATRLTLPKKWKQLKHPLIFLLDATLAVDADAVEVMTMMSHLNHLQMMLRDLHVKIAPSNLVTMTPLGNQKTSLVNHVMVKTADVAENAVTMTLPENLATTMKPMLLKQRKHLYFADYSKEGDDVVTMTALENQEMTTAPSLLVIAMPPENQRM